jgi:hypothetical protein
LYKAATVTTKVIDAEVMPIISTANINAEFAKITSVQGSVKLSSLLFTGSVTGAVRDVLLFRAYFSKMVATADLPKIAVALKTVAVDQYGMLMCVTNGDVRHFMLSCFVPGFEFCSWFKFRIAEI